MLIHVNGRYQTQRVTGVQRYAQEIVNRVGDLVQVIRPDRWTSGIKGHLWEQSILPRQTRGGLLWSPCNTGPISVARQVVTVHDCAFVDYPGGFSRTFGAWYRFMIPRLARRARKIITVSRFSAGRLAEYCKIGEEKIAVIPNGVDPKFRPCGPEEIAGTRSQLNLPENYLLCVGSLEPRKNLPRLLQAWQQVAPNYPGVSLVIAGAKHHTFRQAGIDTLPQRVHLAGYVADDHLPALYAGATAFVYPSLYEGFGLPVLEAMACGTAVVCSSSTSLSEVAGEAAIYVEPTDVDSLAAGIQEILADSDRRATLRALGLERSKQFSWDTAAQRTLETLKQAL
jgi:glycosyltransferase involved in cell wall biosynthesis